MQRLKIALLSLMLPLMGVMTLAAPSTVFAGALQNDACSGLQQVDNTDSCTPGAKSDTLRNIVGNVVSILSYIAGAVAIVMIIVSGFKYMTSGGDAAKAGSAKTTLIYALIGLAVAALAQFLAHWAVSAALTVQ